MSFLGSSVSKRSNPPLKSAFVHLPRSFTPSGGKPPVFLNSAMPLALFCASGVHVNVRMNFITWSVALGLTSRLEKSWLTAKCSCRPPARSDSNYTGRSPDDGSVGCLVAQKQRGELIDITRNELG